MECKQVSFEIISSFGELFITITITVTTNELYISTPHFQMQNFVVDI